jgi:cytoskeletal protein CcmA (bactofilin family)
MGALTMWNVQPTPGTSDQPQRQSQVPNATVTEDKKTVACIGKSIVFKGELFSSEDMRIDGHVEGTVHVRDHDLIVGPHAVIRAEIVAKTIMVLGTVAGTMTATDRIKIGETASIEGNVTAPRLAIIEGATLKGRLSTAAAEVDAQRPRAQLAAVV